MIEINLVGGAIFVLNVILTIVLSRMRRIGISRSAGISGWISALLGTFALVFYYPDIFTFITSSIAIAMGILTSFAIIFIIFPALSPNANLGFFGKIAKYSTWTGYFIGYVIAVILAFLK
ncbi:hypothetical protein KKF81_01010 [Candidatus Micrarchaeota archaeon]|nr:hypothetical protein [Candidatus Micrarchaeota archaeon]MBU1165499.1 hypothetical protein [Candidatus Micrarchaeota archaeon]MBU1886337.1 hypothetical protein [Candidatus Micrarchaeota archaeon]